MKFDFNFINHRGFKTNIQLTDVIKLYVGKFFKSCCIIESVFVIKANFLYCSIN